MSHAGQVPIPLAVSILAGLAQPWYTTSNNSVTPEELARSGAPAINGAIKVSKGENGAVRVKIGYRPFPSFELIRDLNGQSTLAWYNDQDGGPERLLFPAETVEFDA